ncbi:MAG: type II secretion system secretin GspD [Phenylobacterium sp.]|uniref:type II secretion system secretin GspD n=1 Tax=Phenylobacterium sp. TaxID=1871053 RepID=UPI0027306432|nr:type II secretion system secretin GspD [Phenylobacterium sp.]MDP1618225.1 type II secretion system secretin GspD [Phenylobacterium sp.]MDP1988873.1 type II secretion system secretin GspD [Phenylobacterium sp.]MDP3384531.1 type II secretion system secretin GspD [Phenylobacterium sp.]
MKRLIALAILLASGASLGPTPVAYAQQQTLNLQDADIRVFIQDVARATGQTFIIDPRVQGKVSISSNEPLSRNELFEVMLSTLRANGLVAVPAGAGVYRITPEEGAAAQPSSLSGGGGYGFSTQVFRLRNIDAVSAAETLKPLIGRQGVIMPSPRGNLLVVADYADNLTRIRSLLGQVDQDRTLTETVTLRSSSAREIASVVNQVLNPPGADPGSRNGIVSLVVVESSNSLILRGEPEAVRPLLDLVRDLDSRAETSGDVRVINLQHADAEQLVPVLQQLVGQAPTQSGNDAASATQTAAAGDQTATAGGGGRRANIARYPGANAIVIAADPDTQRVLGEVIRQLDTRRRQVLVEAVVVELSDNAAQQLGVQFALAGINGSSIPFSATNYSNAAPNLLALAGAAAGEANLPEDSAALAALRQTAMDSLLGARGMITGGYGRSGDALFGFIINAVKNDTTSNLLSTPSVMTLDNQEATILVGQEIPITTGEVLGDSNSNPFRTVQRQDVGIQLEVKPQINAGGAITLFLRQEVSSIAGPVSEDYNELILDKRSIQTTVAVDDGAIVVLGGLLDRNERTTVERTPILGDIPVVGNLFKATSRQNVQRNLMVFIRPTIIESAADAQALTAPRYAYIRDRELARSPDGLSNLDALVRDYMQAEPITALPPPPPPPPGL